MIHSPCGTNDREADAQGNAQTSPCVWRYRFEKGSDVEGLAVAGKEHVCDG